MISAVSYQFERFVEFAEERVKAGIASDGTRPTDDPSGGHRIFA